MIESYRGQVEYSFKVGVPDIGRWSFDKIIVAGMGGSALPGELLRDYYKKKPVIVVRDYLVPDFVNSKSLVFVISYSGNTEETLSAYRDAKKKKARIIIMTAGGELGKAKGERVMLPSSLQPRDAVPSMFIILLRILGERLDKNRLLKVFDSIEERKYADIIKELSAGRIPVVYGCSEDYKGVARTWKNLFNEDCKTICHAGVFTEVNHNELEADTKGFVFILLDDSRGGRIGKQIDFAESIFHFHRIKLGWNSLLERMIGGLLAGDAITKGFAKKNGIDAFSTKRIAELKRFLIR